MTMTGLLAAPRASLAPVRARIDRVGVVEHSRRAVPAPEFGHCLDDAGRALGMAARMSADRDALFVAEACMRQIEASHLPSRGFVLRLDEEGRPTGDPLSDDGWARALWGLAHAATGTLGPGPADRALQLVQALSNLRTLHVRAAAHAVLAGVTMMSVDDLAAAGRTLVEAHAAQLPELQSPVAGESDGWPWPEPRLTYSNALIVEAMLALSVVRDDDLGITAALGLLGWLVALETSADGHLSFTPVGGRGPGEPSGFDQQPIEAWTLADAALRAYRVTGDDRWADAVRCAAAWFEGANDVGTPMWDPSTGAAFDGLTAGGVNLNQGAESALAFIATRHAAESLTLSPGTTFTPRSSSR